MNFLPGFFALSSAWLFFLVPPLIIFYFLKLKRPRLDIPSLMLWRQVLQDNRVNSPFQRFRRNILLLIQLLLLLFLILAAMQPYWRGDNARAARLPVLIDCSASMGALDKAGGVTRLDAARAQVSQMIDGMLGDQEMCLISFGRTGRKLTDFTNNRRILHDALDKIAVQDLPSDAEDGLRIAEALSRSSPFDHAVLFSDGNFPMPSHFQLPFKLDYRRLPPAGPNVGITALTAQRTGDTAWSIFVSIEASGDEPASAVVELRSGVGDPVKQDVTVSRGKPQRLMFKVSLDKRATFEVHLSPDGFDSLASDNVAYITLTPPRPVWVYVPETLVAERYALRVMPGVRLFPEAGKPATESSYDLVISDNPADLAHTNNTACLIGAVPDELKSLVTIGKDSTTAVDWLRESPLLQHVELSDLVVLNGPKSGDGVRENEFENLGCEALVYGQLGPLIVQKREETKSSFYILFDPARSTLPYRVAFPVMLSNLVRIAMQQAGLAEAHGNTTGVLPPVQVGVGKTVTVESPDGQTWSETADEHGVLSGVPAQRVGKYRIGSDTEVGVGLLSPEESSLRGLDQLNFAETSVAASTGKLKVDKSFWPMLAGLAMALLLFEWWFYQKKPGGFTG